MALKKTSAGWRVDIWTDGRGSRRVRKTFTSKAAALRFERWVRSQTDQREPWTPAKKDSRRLLELIDVWYRLHGAQLRDGLSRCRKLERIAERLGNPVTRTIQPKDFTEYRSMRLEEGVSPNTVNHEHAYIRGLFNELRRLGEWKEGNPVEGIRQIRLRERELAFLTHEQIAALLEALEQGRNRDTLRVTKLCLATGARWSEAETLRVEHLFRDRVTFVETKGGKVRSVPISPQLAKELRTRRHGRLFSSCYAGFRHAVIRAGLELPRGQMAHVLRHTFASHFMMNGGNLLTLQRILGHASIQMTMRYAHLAPDYLEEAVRFNPLGSIGRIPDS